MMASRSSCGSRLQVLGHGGDLVRHPGHVGVGQRNKLGIRLVGELPSLFQLTFQPRQPLGQTSDRGQPRVLPTQGLELRRVPGDRRVGKLPLDLRRPL